MLLFLARGVGSCIFAQDYLAVRGLVLVLGSWPNSWWIPDARI